MAVSSDKRWLATADSGPESLLIVWDAANATPIKIISLPEEDNGVVGIDISADSMFLVTLSKAYPQKISIWEWTVGTSVPAISASIGEHGYQHAVRFNPVDVRDLVTTGQGNLIFWNWTQQALAPFHPPKGIKKIKGSVGHLTQTTFIPFTTKAVTATSSGHAILWDYPVSELVQTSGRDAIKVIKVVQKSGINLICTVLDRYIVCGCSDGAVRFFDFQFRVVAWFEDQESGEVTSLSFAETGGPPPAPSVSGNVSMEDFIVPDFLVATKKGLILIMDQKSMQEIEESLRKGRLLVQGFDSDVYGLAAHPFLPLFAAGTREGQLQVWDIDDRRIMASRKFTNDVEAKGGIKSINTVVSGPNPLANFINCLEYSPDGSLLAVGFANGLLKIVRTTEKSREGGAAEAAPTLPDECSFKHCQGAITHLDFNVTGEWLAVAGTDRSVAIYRYYYRDEEKGKPVEWIFVGKYRAHYKPITALYFERREPSLGPGDRPDETPYPRLFSLGDDRVLQEYDLARSSIRAGICLKNSCSVEQTATPTAMCCLPKFIVPPSKHHHGEGKEHHHHHHRHHKSHVSDSDSSSYLQAVANEYSDNLILTASDEFKIRVWDLSSSPRALYAFSGEEYTGPPAQVKLCRQTLLAPTYGGAINKMFVLPTRTGKGGARAPSEFLVYGTSNRVIGLIMMPLDGNPNKNMAIIAHPGEISSVTCSFDGQYLITAGGPDRSVKFWAVNSSAFRASAELAGTGMEPFLNLVEGGRDGKFFQELLDYFYYAQLRSQGLSTTAPRVISGHIPTAEALNVMRALGYYPSEQEVADIRAEVLFQHYGRVDPLRLQVDLEMLIRLYVNHRPVTGVTKAQLAAAFESLGLSPGAEMDRDFLIHSLTTLGEKMDIAELAEIVETLLGALSNKEPLSFLSPPMEDNDPRYDSAEGRALLKFPRSISSSNFAQVVLGFTDYESEKEMQVTSDAKAKRI